MPPSIIKSVDEIVKERWGVKNTTLKLNHQKPIDTPLKDKLFRLQKGTIKNTVEVKIKRGSGVILKSVSPEAERLILEERDQFVLHIETARYPLQRDITAQMFNELPSFSKEDIALTLAERIGEIQREHKEAFDTTIEFMCAGALFNKVYDGSGRLLLELDYEGIVIEYSDTKTLWQVTEEVRNHMGQFYSVENLTITCRCGAEFKQKVHAKALSENLFRDHQAKTDDKTGDLIVHGIRYRTYAKQYDDIDGNEKDFVATGGGSFTADNTTDLLINYSRANHMKAIGKPGIDLYFSAIDTKSNGDLTVVDECRPIAWNSRPETSPNAVWV